MLHHAIHARLSRPSRPVADARGAALEYASDPRIGLILLDIQMPRLEGDAFCRAYRERGGPAPVLVMTALDIDAATVARIGADGYLPKPFDIEPALETIRRLVDAR